MSEISESELELARKYDLTKKIVPFLDRHLIYPILESLTEIYDERVITQMTYDLFKETNMIEFIKDQYRTLNGDSNYPEELVEREAKVGEIFNKLNKETAKTLAILGQADVQAHLKQDKTLNQEYLLKEHGITEEKINDLYNFGQFLYNRGDYTSAADLLNSFRVLSTNSELILSATWGKLACEIINCEWDASLEELDKLKKSDGRSYANPLSQLHNKTWIIHWSLFPFFNSENGLQLLLELFFEFGYLSTIQAACPWILRYLVAAVVSSELSNKTNLSTTQFPKKLRQLITVVGQEQYTYSDPLTDFIKALYIDFDFEEANLKLNEASIILKSDFFLSSITDSFVENARHLISEIYCRVHQRIDLNDFSRSLNLSREEGEKWVASLIEGTKMDAKIDESEGTVILNHQSTGVYRQVIEKTKGISFKANQILTAGLQKQDAV